MIMQNSNNKGIIIILLNQETSAFNASFKLARELSERGYRVVYAVFPIFEAYVAKHKFEYKVIEASDTDMQEQKALSPAQCVLQKDFISTIQAIEKLFATATPKLVLVDQISWWFSIPFLKRNIPIIGLNTCLASAWNSVTPPVFSGTIPNEKIGCYSRIKCLIEWLKLFLYKSSTSDSVDVYKLIAAKYFGRSVLGTLHVTFKKLVNKYGGAVRWGEYGYRLDVPELIMCPREFDFPCLSQRTAQCYIGACVDSHRNDGQSPWGEDGKTYSLNLDELNKEKSLVYCSLGSHAHLCKSKIRLFRATIKAVQQRPNLQLLIQIRDEAEANKCRPLPNNVKVITWAPQLEILSRSFLFITHGGLGSVREAIYFGVPMIVFPFWNDGYGNAARVVFHNLGLRGDIKKVTPKRVGNFIDRISNDNSFSCSVKRMQQLFREQDNCNRAIEFIEQVGLESHTLL